MKTQIRHVLNWAQRSIGSIGVAIQTNREIAGYDRYARSMYKAFKTLRERHGVWGGGLTPVEKEAVTAVLRPFGIRPRCFEYYMIAKMLYGFNPQFLPESIFFPRVLRSLQGLEISRHLTNKSFYGFLFSDVLRPFEPVRCLNGTYYDSENRRIDKAKAIDVMMGFNMSVVIKPALWSGCGRGVEKITEFSRSSLSSLFDRYGANFVCQECVDQDASMASLNETSLNCVRVTSLFLNGRFSVLSNTIKIGARGAFVDNVGNGGYLVGVEASGRLHGEGYDLQGKSHAESYSGKALSSIVVPSMSKVEALVRKCHERLPQLPICGFDIAIDRHAEPVMIEINADFPGVFMEQFSTGPILADRFEEVLTYVSLRRNV